MLTTFGDVQNSRVAEIADASPTTPEFASLVNAATRQLMIRGNWWSTVQPMQGCTYAGCIVWPRRVSSVLAMDMCGRFTQPANRWYRFLDWSGEHTQMQKQWRRHSGRMISDSDGTTPVFNPIPCAIPMLLRFYIDNPLDVGKNVVIYGKDHNDQWMINKRADGTTQDGMVLKLALPYVTSPVPVLSVVRVVKDVTLGKIRGYQVDGGGLLYDMCTYDPQETSPDYVRTRIPGRSGPCTKMITALVKLAFVPVVYPDDQVLIENIDALRDMVFSIKKKEAGDMAGAALLERSAFRELNYEMRNRFPDEQFIVNFRPFGNDTLQRQAIGSMI